MISFLHAPTSRDNFYIIEEGTFQATKGTKLLYTYQGSGSFGELALLYNTPRAATVTAKTDGLLWGVDRATFRQIVVESTQHKRALYEKSLADMELFKHLSSEERAIMADCLRMQVRVAAGWGILQMRYRLLIMNAVIE